MHWYIDIYTHIFTHFFLVSLWKAPCAVGQCFIKEVWLVNGSDTFGIIQSGRAASFRCCLMRLLPAADTVFHRFTVFFFTAAGRAPCSICQHVTSCGQSDDIRLSLPLPARVCLRAHAQWCEEAQALPVTCTCTTWKKNHTHIKVASQSLSQCPLEGLVSLQQLSSPDHTEWLMRIKGPCALTKCLWFCEISFCSCFFYFCFFLTLTNIEGELWTSCNVKEVK